MQILATNNNFLLASNKTQTFLLSLQDLKIIGTKQIYTKYGSLQYGTGIAALTSGSMVLIYDFKYSRELYTLETYKKIFSICIRKNILIIISQSRILLHNLQSKMNECFIQTSNGTIAFVNDDYFQLRIFYPQSNYTLRNRSIWSKKQEKISGGIKYRLGCYFKKGNLIALALQNVLSMYEQHDLVKVYGYQTPIIGICSNEDFIFVVLTTGDVVGQNLRTQFQYKFQKIEECELEAIVVQPVQTKLFVIGNFVYLWHQGILKRANLNEKTQILSKQQEVKNQKLRLQQIQEQKLITSEILQKQKQWLQNQLQQSKIQSEQNIDKLMQLQTQEEMGARIRNNLQKIGFSRDSADFRQQVGKLYRQYDQAQKAQEKLPSQFEQQQDQKEV